MQAIRTEYHGPGNTRGSRIIATAKAGRVFHAYDDALSADANHAAAARELALANGWFGTFFMGTLADESRVFVNAHAAGGWPSKADAAFVIEREGAAPAEKTAGA